jgi:hypothetical protein
MVINVIGVPIQSTKSKAKDTANRELQVAPPKGKTMEVWREREQRNLCLTVSKAQQIIDYMGQMIELGCWAQANPVPTLAQFLQRLLNSGPSTPLPSCWFLHPRVA